MLPKMVAPAGMASREIEDGLLVRDSEVGVAVAPKNERVARERRIWMNFMMQLSCL